ncbi:leucine-rich repeat domain-containing protein [Treponema primitia]|uniref:leucine-rich repeat domain-containing protein n=1 Tax=Treponema primitia TaxID=88058 RepID=UPI00397FA2A1
MNKNKFFLLGMAAVLLTFGLVFAACGGKKDGGSGGAASGGPAAKTASSDVKAAAALLKTLAGGNAAAMEQALAALDPAVLAALASSSGSPGGDFSYDLNASGDGIVIKKYSGAGGVVVIPAAIEDIPVVEIARKAFEGSYTSRLDGNRHGGQGDKVTSVVVPAGVKKIGIEVFFECKNLTTVILPDTLEEIGSGAFANCSKLHTVNIPAGIRTIVGLAFLGCGDLYNLSIPDSITAITFSGISNFEGCGKLKVATRQKLKNLGYTGEF